MGDHDSFFACWRPPPELDCLNAAFGGFGGGGGSSSDDGKMNSYDPRYQNGRTIDLAVGGFMAANGCPCLLGSRAQQLRFSAQATTGREKQFTIDSEATTDVTESLVGVYDPH